MRSFCLSNSKNAFLSSAQSNHVKNLAESSLQYPLAFTSDNQNKCIKSCLFDGNRWDKAEMELSKHRGG